MSVPREGSRVRTGGQGASPLREHCLSESIPVPSPGTAEALGLCRGRRVPGEANGGCEVLGETLRPRGGRAGGKAPNPRWGRSDAISSLGFLSCCRVSCALEAVFSWGRAERAPPPHLQGSPQPLLVLLQTTSPPVSAPPASPRHQIPQPAKPLGSLAGKSPARARVTPGMGSGSAGTERTGTEGVPEDRPRSATTPHTLGFLSLRVRVAPSFNNPVTDKT